MKPLYAFLLKHISSKYYAQLSDLLIPSLPPSLFQLVKKQIWRSHSSKSDDSRGCLSSIVLDASDKLPHQKSFKENRFIYRFVHRDLSSINVKALGRDPLSVASSPKSDMDCTLRSGDYVVQLFSCNTFFHDVTLAKFGLLYGIKILYRTLTVPLYAPPVTACHMPFFFFSKSNQSLEHKVEQRIFSYNFCIMWCISSLFFDIIISFFSLMLCLDT